MKVAEDSEEKKGGVKVVDDSEDISVPKVDRIIISPQNQNTSQDVIACEAANLTSFKSSAAAPTPRIRDRTIVITECLPSPLRAEMKGHLSRDHDKFFAARITKNVGGIEKQFIAYKTKGEYNIEIDRSATNRIVEYQYTEELGLHNVKWVNCAEIRDRSAALRKLWRDKKPDPLEMAFGNARVLVKFRTSKSSDRVQRQLRHGLCMYIEGTCQAGSKKNKCATTWVVGFTEDSLVKLAKGAESIPMGLTVWEDCEHVKDESYGQCRGDERKDLVSKVSSQSPKDRLTVKANILPKVIMESQNNSLSQSASHALNHGGKAISSYTARNVKRDAKANLHQQHELTGRDTTRDVGRAVRKTQLLDLAARKARKDTSVDFPGIFRGQCIGGDIDAKLGKDSIGVRIVMFSKSNVKLFHNHAKTGFGCLNYDGTGCDANCHIDTNDGEYVLVNVLSVGKNLFVVQDESNMVGGKINTKVVGQFISNRNATCDHQRFLQQFVDAEFAIYGVTYAPLFFLTDCAGQLENAALLVWKSPKTGEPIVKPLYANIALIVILEIERNKYSLEACEKYIKLLQTYTSVLLHQCKPHSIKDGKVWVVSAKRKPEHKKYQGQFKKMLMHLFCHASGEWNISEAIVHAGLLLYICKEKSLDVNPWDNTVKVQDKSDRFELLKIGRGMRQFIDKQKHRLEESGNGKFEELIEEQENQNQRGLEYMARELVVGVATRAKEQKLKFYHCYAKERSDDTATIRVTIIHGIDSSKIPGEDEYECDIHPPFVIEDDPEKYCSVGSDDGEKEIYEFVGGAEVSVRRDETVFLNPYYNPDMAEYIRLKRGGTLPLWSNAIIKSASKAKGRKVDNSNSQSEGIIRWLKEDPDYHRHCVSLALYIIYWYFKNVDTDALYATQVQGLEASVEASNKRNDKKDKKAAGGKTKEETKISNDMRLLEEENTKDTLWSKKGWDLGESKLKERINDACGHQVTDKQYYCIKFYATHETDYYLAFMGKATYAAWKNGCRKSQSMLNVDSIKIMDDFAKLHEEGCGAKLNATIKGGEELMARERSAKKARDQANKKMRNQANNR